MTIFDCFGVSHPLGLDTPEEAIDLDIFTGIHRMYTMFLADKKQNEPMGGFTSRTLDPVGLGYLLDSIRDIMETSLGPITFGEFTMLQRNKLCTHGDLSFDSLENDRDPYLQKMGKQAKMVPLNQEAVENYHVLMERLISEVKALRVNLEAILQDRTEWPLSTS